MEEYRDGDVCPPINFMDRRRGKLSFYDENKQKIIDMDGQKLCQRLTNNLQNIENV